MEARVRLERLNTALVAMEQWLADPANADLVDDRRDMLEARGVLRVTADRLQEAITEAARGDFAGRDPPED